MLKYFDGLILTTQTSNFCRCFIIYISSYLLVRELRLDVIFLQTLQISSNQVRIRFYIVKQKMRGCVTQDIRDKYLLSDKIKFLTHSKIFENDQFVCICCHVVHTANTVHFVDNVIDNVDFDEFYRLLAFKVILFLHISFA